MTVPNLATAVGRVQFAVGDMDDTAPLLPGGTAQYTAVLAAFSGDEARAYRHICGALAATYAAQGDRVSSGAGKVVDWQTRVPLWLAAARGGAPVYPFAPGGASPGTGANVTEVVW